MNELLQSEEAQEAFRGVIEFIPLLYVVFVILASIGFDVLNYDGTLARYYKIKIFAICVSLAVVAYFFYPEDQVKIRDIPVFIFGTFLSIAIIKYLSYRWKKKKK